MITLRKLFICPVFLLMFNFVCCIHCVGDKRSLIYWNEFIQRYNEYNELKIALISKPLTVSLVHTICNYNQMSNNGDCEEIEFIVYLILVMMVLLIAYIGIVIQDFHGYYDLSIYCSDNEDGVNDRQPHPKFTSQGVAKTDDTGTLKSKSINNSRFHCVIVILLIKINSQFITFQSFHKESLDQLYLYSWPLLPLSILDYYIYCNTCVTTINKTFTCFELMKISF